VVKSWIAFARPWVQSLAPPINKIKNKIARNLETDQINVFLRFLLLSELYITTKKILPVLENPSQAHLY
jgi:hypothetical protein